MTGRRECHVGVWMDGRTNRWKDDIEGQSGRRQGAHTSCDPQHSHDADDGRVDGQSVAINLFQNDAHDGQQHDGQIQLVPPTQRNTHTCWSLALTYFP